MKTPEEIKRGLECGNCDGCPYARWDEKTGQFADHHCEFVETDALAYIRQLEQRVPRWISVEERLPEKHIGVIAICEDRYIDLMTYDGRHWNWNGKHEDSVTHWMPLPEPPEEGDDEG